MKTCPICKRKTVSFFGTSSYKCSSCGIVPGEQVQDKSASDKQIHDTVDEVIVPFTINNMEPREFYKFNLKYWWLVLGLLFVLFLLAIIVS